MASVAATSASEAESVNAPTPTPATPSTPQHASSFAGPKTEGQGQANMIPGLPNGGPEQMPPPQPDPNTIQFGLEGGDVSFLLLLFFPAGAKFPSLSGIIQHALQQ